MNEDEVKKLTERWLKKQGYKIRAEVGVSGTNRDVILDFYGFQNTNPPSILWVECKGDESLSQVLEGFIRTEFAIFYGGGQGILAVPERATKKLLKYKEFLKGSDVWILNVESNCIVTLRTCSDHLKSHHSTTHQL